MSRGERGGGPQKKKKKIFFSLFLGLCNRSPDASGALAGDHHQRRSGAASDGLMEKTARDYDAQTPVTVAP